jgi:hypothetical protein
MIVCDDVDEVAHSTHIPQVRLVLSHLPSHSLPGKTLGLTVVFSMTKEYRNYTVTLRIENIVRNERQAKPYCQFTKKESPKLLMALSI